ncbi:hypothetical protein AB6A40_007110 [Gnathostoma spinigerum]|uniref:Uncharacterized protein n=1 Tax=Gnathostoma spinigerum TaxID=75299 RepID=A0ABD6EM99_9BILA
MRFPIGFSLFVVVIAICGILVIASSSSENAKHVEKGFSNDALSGQLRYYEIVTDLHVIDSGGVRVSSKNHFYGLSQVIFSAFNQSFHIYLTPKYGLFAQNFAYYEVGKNGDKREMTLNTDHLYEGYVKDSSDSEVSLSFDNDQSLIGSVRVNSEIYYFEPARLHNLARRTGDILAYRNSDVDEGFMRSIVWQNYSLKTFDLPKSSAFYIQRDERDAHPVLKNRCSLKIVADYSFFKIVGQGDRLSVSRYLINVIDRVNTIFTRQDWGVGRRNQRMINMGFMIKEMLIHTSPYDTPHDPYNTAAIDEHFDVQLLLKRFTEAEGTTKYCLVHLFTALTFKNGVMGLSYVGGPEISQFGGICSISYNGISYNTGLSTARSKMGRNVITRGTDLILAHEFGHSWGSNHDETPDCLPDLQNGGPYLMNPSVTSGRDINNPVFSPCSVRMIGEVLFKKSAICFETEVSSFCGNGLVERETRTSNYSEQCDSGGFLPHKGDACCTAECRLKEGALCSPGNSPCCSDKCQFMPAGSVCSPENPAQCMQTAYCTLVTALFYLT